MLTKIFRHALNTIVFDSFVYTDILTITFTTDPSSPVVRAYFRPFAWHTISFFSVMMAFFVIIWNKHSLLSLVLFI